MYYSLQHGGEIMGTRGVWRPQTSPLFLRLISGKLLVHNGKIREFHLPIPAEAVIPLISHYTNMYLNFEGSRIIF